MYAESLFQVFFHSFDSIRHSQDLVPWNWEGVMKMPRITIQRKTLI